jgi:glycosyltransferase involved in cell wall biosynthesis
MAVVIGVLTTSYPRFAGDAAGSFVETRVRELLAAGHEVEVLAAGDDGAGSTGAPRLRVVRVPCAIAGAPPLFYGAGAPETIESDGTAALLTGARFFAGLVAAARSRVQRWHRLESHWLVPSGLAAAEVANGRPHRAHAHSGDVALLERMPGGASIGRLIGRRGAELIFASADLRRRFARLVGDAAVARAAVVPAPPALAAMSSGDRARARDDLALGGRIVLGVGRLVPIKGYDVLVRAVARLPVAARPTVVLLGEGPERAALVRQAAAAGVDLRLVGSVPHPQVARYLAVADLFVHPCRTLGNGRTEGQPVAVAEALAAGLPVIASASGGLPEMARRGVGFELVPPDDPAALAAALTRATQSGYRADHYAVCT